MKCPIDQTPLVMSERQGVEIDYCPQCRGVWLDRGELDKIIERAAVEQPGLGAPGGSGPAGAGAGGPAGPTPAQPTYPPPAQPGYPPPAQPGYPPPAQPGSPSPYGGPAYGGQRYRYRSPDSAPSAPSPPGWRGQGGYGRDAYGRPYRRKRESWLGDLFDF